MARLVCAALLTLNLLLLPVPAQAASFNMSFSRQNDGTTIGEFWYNDKIVWRLKICSDGARPVTGQHSPATTVVVPDVVNGLFLFKIGSQ
jgi:hypothetical protein